MKIAQVVCVYPPYRGGIGKVAEDISDNLISCGHQVTVFTPFANTNKNVKESFVHRLKYSLKFGNAAFMPALFWRINNFDVVYLHYPFFGSSEIIFLLKLFFRKKFKLVIHYHMDTRNLSLVKEIFTIPSLLIRNKLFSIADMIVCASVDYIKSSEIAEIYKNNSEKFIEIPFAVDIDRFKPMEKKDETKIRITFVGGMDKAHDFKGVDILIKSFAEIKNSKIELNLVGNGSLITEYKQLAKYLKIDKKVRFLSGFSDDEKIKEYQKSDIFVLPSINSHEAFGIVLLEAMSCGVPVVASSLPGVRKVFKDGEQGFEVMPASQKDLRKKLEKLINNRDLREQMGVKSRKLVKERYSYKMINKKTEDSLFNLLKK